MELHRRRATAMNIRIYPKNHEEEERHKAKKQSISEGQYNFVYHSHQYINVAHLPYELSDHLYHSAQDLLNPDVKIQSAKSSKFQQSKSKVKSKKSAERVCSLPVFQEGSLKKNKTQRRSRFYAILRTR